MTSEGGYVSNKYRLGSRKFEKIRREGGAGMRREEIQGYFGPVE